jgi:hypothetical protein
MSPNAALKPLEVGPGCYRTKVDWGSQSRVASVMRRPLRPTPSRLSHVVWGYARPPLASSPACSRTFAVSGRRLSHCVEVASTNYNSLGWSPGTRLPLADRITGLLAIPTLLLWDERLYEYRGGLVRLSWEMYVDGFPSRACIVWCWILMVDEGLLKDLRVNRYMLLLPQARSSTVLVPETVVDVTVLDIECGSVLSYVGICDLYLDWISKAYGEKRYSPTIINFGTRWMWVVSFKPPLLNPWGRSPQHPLGPRVGLEAVEKRKISYLC